jgi:enoyl-CoA hydratase
MIHVESRGATTLVTIDRPERRNALDHEALDGLLAALSGAGADAASGSLRVLVLTGTDGHFCAGADLTTVEDEGFVAKLHDLLEGLRAAPFPTMAAVDGAALGAGTQLAVACDLRIATPGATFGIPAGKLGLMTDQWTVTRMAGVAGQALARAMLLAAEVCPGERAHQIGLVTRLAGPDDLVDAALAWADQIARLAPLTLAGFKVGLNEAEGALEWTPAYRGAFERAWASQDLQEGLAAFAERRTPGFRGS